MSKDKACISAVKEVCPRCNLYKENCGMLDFPDQCSESGRYIDGYRQAEKDLELTWEDMMIIHKCIKDAMNYKLYKMMEGVEGQKEVYEDVLKRFKERKEK